VSGETVIVGITVFVLGDLRIPVLFGVCVPDLFDLEE